MSKKNKTTEKPKSPAILKLNVGNHKQPDHHNAKLTPKKRVTFLEEYAKHANISRAAAIIGCSHSSINSLKERDEDFRNAFEAVEHGLLNQVEEVMFQTAADGSHKHQSQNGRFLLERHPRSRQKYGREMNVNITGKITHDLALPTIQDMLDRFGYNQVEQTSVAQIDDAEFLEVNASD